MVRGTPIGVSLMPKTEGFWSYFLGSKVELTIHCTLGNCSNDDWHRFSKSYNHEAEDSFVELAISVAANIVSGVILSTSLQVHLVGHQYDVSRYSSIFVKETNSFNRINAAGVHST